MKNLMPQLSGAAFLSIFIPSVFLCSAKNLYAQQQTGDEEPTTINISANPLAPNLAEYGKAASIIRKDEIQQRAQSTLGETIGLEPGVSSSFFGQGASRPVIRGFSGERVRVLKNGVGTGDASDISEDHVVVADPMQASQIEILRGPETLLYGSSAIGGSVNVLDDSIAEEEIGLPFKGEFLGQLGDSADNEQTGALELKGQTEGLNWYISGFSRETDSYEIPGFAESDKLREQEELEHSAEKSAETEDHEEETKGKVLNSDSDSSGATVAGSHVWKDGFIGISSTFFNSDYGVPGHSHAEEEEHLEHEDSDEEHNDQQHEDQQSHASGHDDNVRIDAEEMRFDMRGQVNSLGRHLKGVKFRLAATDYEHKEIEGGETATKFERSTFESRVELLHNGRSGLNGAIGLQMLYDDFAATGDEAFLAPTKTTSPALFAFEELSLNSQLELEFGARIEHSNLQPVNLPSKNFVPFSLSAGPVWDPGSDGRYNLGLTFGYSERAPSSAELFSDGPHLARQIYEIGNQDLDKERSWGIDLVVRKNSGFLRSSLTPFFQDFYNYINLAADGAEEDGLPVYSYEEVRAKFWGFELENSLHFDEIYDLPVTSLLLEHQIDFTKARNDSGRDDLPRIPPLRNIIRIKSDLSDKISAMAEAVLVSSQDEISEFELPTDSYNLLNAELTYKLPVSEAAGMKLFVKGTNLGDDEARVHSSFLKDLAPLRGRAFIFGVRGSF